MPAKIYYRPIAQTDRQRPDNAYDLAGGPVWFSHAEKLVRGKQSQLISAGEIPADILADITGDRAPICGLSLNTARIMGVLNVTPDSFSDGGMFDGLEAACSQAAKMVSQGADLLDIGGESTRPGADFVEPELEIERTSPVIAALKKQIKSTPISIDTRKASVARSALQAGAALINDVSALSYDDKMLKLLGESRSAVCLMHASGDPKTMQNEPQYEDVLLDVFDYLEARVKLCVDYGIPREKILIDPGIGFGKTLEHNLALIRGLSLFHGLGCAILLGVSRKRFIGTIANEPVADRRASGSIAVALEGVRQGVQMLRVHDIRETKQALLLANAIL